MKRFTDDICLTFTIVVLACFTLIPAPKAFAVDPPPDGGYPAANDCAGWTY